jgi:prepilin-type N-terminal cleavage/methylation domain-containing protein
MNPNNFYKEKKGFSLIETLIAISILMIAVTGPFALVQAGLFSSNHQRNQVTATFLAQEALEYVKNMRDTNSYTQYGATTANWLTIPNGDSTQTLDVICGIGCYVDPHGKLPVDGGNGGNIFVQVAPSGGSDMYLKQTTIGGVFSYSYDSSGTDTLFKRTVKVNLINPDEARVSVTVGWSDGLVPRTYTVSEELFNYLKGENDSIVINGGGDGGGNTYPITALVSTSPKTRTPASYGNGCALLTNVSCDFSPHDSSIFSNGLYWCDIYDNGNLVTGGVYVVPGYTGYISEINIQQNPYEVSTWYNVPGYYTDSVPPVVANLMGEKKYSEVPHADHSFTTRIFNVDVIGRDGNHQGDAVSDFSSPTPGINTFQCFLDVENDQNQ